MSDITIKINGRECHAKEGEYILNVARREGIFIPAICYLNRCSPTLACRICLVEADGKRSYSCNTKVKEGMEVITDSDEIAAERKAIMQVYDVNHPLQCGVCDQSGECELQNYTLYMGVDKQEYATPDTFRPIREWGLMKYDAGLCIVCEKCVTVCKDMIGDAVLKTVPRGGEPLDKELKTKMPKDAYAMWNKLQKSIIGTVNEDNSLECQECGECIAVCPVGALVSSDFQYKANAWELKRIPASNPHSSDCALLYYEVKHASAKDPSPRIYRVTNDAHFVTLNGAARFGYDFENRVAGKDKAAFEKVVAFIEKEADTIAFSSFITNEEALILQKLKEKKGLKLYNPEAKAYQDFLGHYSHAAGTSLYSGDLKKIRSSNFVVSVGTAIRYDSPNSGFAFNNAMKMNKGAGLYFHPVSDRVVESFGKNVMSVAHKPGAEEHILSFLLAYFSDKRVGEGEKLPEDIAKKIGKYDTEAVGLPEDFEAKMTKMLAKKDRFSLILGEDLYRHPRAENIAKLAGLIDRYTDFEVTLIPSRTNTLGVALICDLDETPGEKVLGYNENGAVVLSALGEGDLDMPALNQQEGTFTNIDKRVVPTNAAIGYDGYELNDIANALGLTAENTIDYTPQLPTDAGFVPLQFDLLPNFFDNGGNELRGYLLEGKGVEMDTQIETPVKPELLEGEILYLGNPINQFSPFTNKAHQLKSEGALYVSSDWLEEKGLAEGDVVEVKGDGHAIEVKVELDKQIGGGIGYLPTFDRALEVAPLFKDGYRFATVSIQKVNR